MPTTAAKEKLYRLIDALPEGELHAAERYLEYLRDHGDPLLTALLNGPEEDHMLSEAGRAALDEGHQDLDAGRVVSHEDARRQLLGGSTCRA